MHNACRACQWFIKRAALGLHQIDDKEELLQQSLGDLCQCADEIMEQAGVCKGLRCVETIICEVEHIHSWLAEICSEVFYEGRENLIITHSNYNLIVSERYLMISG